MIFRNYFTFWIKLIIIVKKRKGLIMATLSNSNIQKNMIEEINSIFIDFFQIVKTFVYKHHKIIGYF